jgi:hypothetical protein
MCLKCYIFVDIQLVLSHCNLLLTLISWERILCNKKVEIYKYLCSYFCQNMYLKNVKYLSKNDNIYF